MHLNVCICIFSSVFNFSYVFLYVYMLIVIKSNATEKKIMLIEDDMILTTSTSP